jgi:hypothetical protein
VFAIVALCGISRHGKRGLLGRGLAGAVINGVLVLAMVVGAVTAVGRRVQGRREAAKEVQSASRELRESVGKNYDPDVGITNDGTQQLGEYRSKLDSAAKKTSGKDALSLQALSAYMGRIQAEAKKFSVAADKLTQAEVVNLGTLKEKNQIAERRQVVQDFLVANKIFKEALAKQDEILKEELLARKLKPAQVEEMMVPFRRSQAPLLKKAMAIRETDDKLGQYFLKLLDIAEAQWGQFRHDKATATTVFENDAAAEEFNALVAEVQDVADEQTRLQGELIKLQKLLAEAQR